MNVDTATSVVAELKGLRQGLKLALELGIDKLCVDIDALLLRQWIWGDKSHNRSLKLLIDDCRILCCRFDEIQACYPCLSRSKHMRGYTGQEGQSPARVIGHL
ncbi:hypothetical protein CDL15_Pgr006458 [Punica granatum]|uniref:RNase H type-1 domain-containing protein n=1 Tax=Punica granatum TaxID=22663 RepID=A0A218XYK5_PUNGR|nr:hypothetical protein CDL15_Pgr006458 [Punica granatum]